MTTRERLEQAIKPVALSAGLAGVVGDRPIFWRSCVRCGWHGIAFAEDQVCTNVVPMWIPGAPSDVPTIHAACGGSLVVDIDAVPDAPAIEPPALVKRCNVCGWEGLSPSNERVCRQSQPGRHCTGRLDPVAT